MKLSTVNIVDADDDLRKIISRADGGSGGCLQPDFKDIKRRTNNETSYPRDIAGNEVIEALRLNQYAKVSRRLPMHVVRVLDLGSPPANKSEELFQHNY